MKLLFPKQVNVGSSPTGCTTKQIRDSGLIVGRQTTLALLQPILDILFVYGPRLSFDELWDRLPDRLRAHPYNQVRLSRAINDLVYWGWVSQKEFKGATCLTAAAWLKLSIGQYP